MNRRNFIKKGAIWCPAIVGLKAYPQALTLADPAKIISYPSAGCASWINQPLRNDYLEVTSAGGTYVCQKLKITSSTTICKAIIALRKNSVLGSLILSVRSDPNNGGTQYGSDSNDASPTDDSAWTWVTYTFATDPVVSGDCWLTLRLGATSGNTLIGIQSGNPYETTAYYAQSNSTTFTDYDFAMEVYR
jgi:hypothetical protein